MLDRQESLGCIGQADGGPAVILEHSKVMTITDAL